MTRTFNNPLACALFRMLSPSTEDTIPGKSVRMSHPISRKYFNTNYLVMIPGVLAKRRDFILRYSYITPDYLLCISDRIDMCQRYRKPPLSDTDLVYN